MYVLQRCAVQWLLSKPCKVRPPFGGHIGCDEPRCGNAKLDADDVCKRTRQCEVTFKQAVHIIHPGECTAPSVPQTGLRQIIAITLLQAMRCGHTNPEHCLLHIGMG